MKRRKKTISTVLVLSLICAILSGCGKSGDANKPTEAPKETQGTTPVPATPTPTEGQIFAQDLTNKVSSAKQSIETALTTLKKDKVTKDEMENTVSALLKSAVKEQGTISSDVFAKNRAGFQDVRDAVCDGIDYLGPEIETTLGKLTYTDNTLDEYYRIELESLSNRFVASCDNIIKVLKNVDESKGDIYSISEQERAKIDAFFAQKDENGVSNLDKTANAKVLERVSTTDKSKSVEESKATAMEGLPLGAVVEGGRFIGFGIHILNPDVYPLGSFRIYLRGIDLTGFLDLSDCSNIEFIDVYNNRISGINVKGMTDLKILGIQNNKIESVDPTTLVNCLGIDAGKNKISTIDVSKNAELVELYVNDNNLTEIDISHNPRLKYFYCHNNKITTLDTTSNP